ncbi:hypothetical protein BGZ83_009059 [Gryganskiella cystojenkinii]|nr:hypothetical protein BGZ83_009059 [Gryganskiella cystojenkinii]
MFSSQSSILVALFTILAFFSITVESKQSVKFGKTFSGKNTWFAGKDARSVACYGDLEGNSNVNVNDAWHIGAVNLNSYSGGEKAACFECAKITYKRRSVIVRIIDDCQGCASNQIDLSKSAFSSLASLSVGVINSQVQWVKCPSKGIKWPSSPKVKNS